VSSNRAISRRVLIGVVSDRRATSTPGSTKPRSALGVLSFFSRASNFEISASSVGSARARGGHTDRSGRYCVSKLFVAGPHLRELILDLGQFVVVVFVIRPEGLDHLRPGQVAEHDLFGQLVKIGLSDPDAPADATRSLGCRTRTVPADDPAGCQLRWTTGRTSTPQ
jgi:hypothetical protein